MPEQHDPFDAELRDRIGAAESRVPVASTPPTGVPAGHSPAGWLRRALTLATAAAAVVLAVLVIGQLPDRSTGDSSPLPSASDGVSASARNGDFVLTLSSPRSTWTTSDAIQITATLSYDGGEASLEIGGGGGPVVFSLTQLEGGNAVLAGGQDLPCLRYSLGPDAPLVWPFQKAGGHDDEPPFDRAFFEDPELRLPPGRWEVEANLQYGNADCEDIQSLVVLVQIVVRDEPVEPSADPTPSLAPSPAPSATPNSAQMVFESTWADCCYVHGAIEFVSLIRNGVPVITDQRLDQIDILNVDPGAYRLELYHIPSQENGVDPQPLPPSDPCVFDVVALPGESLLITVRWYIGEACVVSRSDRTANDTAVVQLTGTWPFPIYVEGAQTYVTLAGPTDIKDRLFHNEDRIALRPGHYSMTVYHRPCNVGCDFRLDPPRGHCSTEFDVLPGAEVRATIVWSTEGPCQVTIGS